MIMPYWMYRRLMKFIHLHGYHKMEESHPDGDTMLWCHWCGIRVVLKRDEIAGMRIVNNPKMPKNQIDTINPKHFQ